MAENKTKSYALSKTKVREMITEKFGTEGQVDIASVIALFEGSTGGAAGQTTIVYNDDREVIGKRCSYFGVFLAIDEFGKRGDTYSYQSKLAESIVRKNRTLANNAKKLADDQLAEDVIDANEWKEKLSEIAEMKDSKVSFEDACNSINADLKEGEEAKPVPTGYETAEDLKAAV